MRVLVIPADLAGCGYYRLIWAAEYLAKQGHDIVIQWPKTGGGLNIHVRGDEVVDCDVPQDADVIVLQRVAHMWHSQVIQVLRNKGVGVVIDMDDDLTAIHRKNKAWLTYHPKSNTPYSWKNAEQSCRDASVVTVSAKNLLNVYARHGRGFLIHNFVPERYLMIQRPPQELKFGWAGTTQSHPTDLQVCGKAVQQLTSEGYRFKVIGPPSEVRRELRLTADPEFTGVVSIHAWANAVAQLDVAMAPLEASTFNQSKSALKIIEAMSVGVPFVASPRTEYRRVVAESGGGLLAETPKEWHAKIKQLMDDEVMRKELGEQGREYMKTQTIEANAWRHLEAWTKAYEMERGNKA